MIDKKKKIVPLSIKGKVFNFKVTATTKINADIP